MFHDDRNFAVREANGEDDVPCPLEDAVGRHDVTTAEPPAMEETAGKPPEIKDDASVDFLGQLLRTVADGLRDKEFESLGLAA